MELLYPFAETESRWQAAWQAAGCFRAGRPGQGPRFYNYDSGPFPNGPLHLGHVRTYVLGDVTARYQRALGKAVLYTTEFDAFGLPNELAALELGISPREFTQECTDRMRAQLARLGISYDTSRFVSTCAPEYYATTQWLFLEMFRRGLVERRAADLCWCPRCQTTLARMQVHEGACWRCETPIEIRSLEQWFVTLARFSPTLLAGLDHLPDWSARSKRLLRGFIGGPPRPASEAAYRVHDWCISRQRRWGTPIPIIYCPDCGLVPVPDERLPVLVPEDGDWSTGRPPAAPESFVQTPCPRCGHPGRRETDTLDCFFDDIWCFLAGLRSEMGTPALSAGGDMAWLPVDCFHSGYDTFFYLHLHRFLGLLLHDWGILADPELIHGYTGHDMVLAGGRKMSKHLGNAVSPEALLQRYGADALRVGIVWAAGPQHPIQWSDALVERAVVFLREVYALFDRCGPMPVAGDQMPGVTRRAATLSATTSRGLARIARFIEQYRPNAALDVLATLRERLADFALPRIQSQRLSAADRRSLAANLASFAIALGPFAPHLAEQTWRMVGGQSLIAQARWPSTGLLTGLTSEWPTPLAAD